MSVNWHYFRTIKNMSAGQQVPKATDLTMHTIGASSKDLEAFTGYMVDQRNQAKTGRSWRAEEMRLKDHTDLHKLWYVLLKEKNKLKSDHLMCKQLQQQFYGFADLTKLRLSMARLLTVVNERKRLRNQYRMHLEDEYIRGEKAKEREAFLVERQRLMDLGQKKLPKTSAEVRTEIRAAEDRKRTKFTEARDSIKRSIDDAETPVTTAPMLDDKDVDFIAQTKVGFKQKDILKMYVGNWADLDLR